VNAHEPAAALNELLESLALAVVLELLKINARYFFKFSGVKTAGSSEVSTVNPLVAASCRIIATLAAMLSWT
jgi:hypothetical protein